MGRFWQRHSLALAAIAVLLLGGLAYLPSLGYPYLQDAVSAVAGNPVVERGDLVEIFTSDYWKGTRWDARHLYRPVTVVSFALERALTGDPDPLVSRLVNLLLHQLVALVLFAYARRLGARPALALTAAALFTVHPLALQAVVNVAGRSDLLAALFTLLALLALTRTGAWRGGDPPAPRIARAAAWCAAAAAFLALGAKEIAIALPLLVLLQEGVVRLPRRGPGAAWWIDRAASLAPVVLATLAWLLLRTRAIGVFPGLQEIPPEDNVIVQFDLHGWSRLATALGMAARYAGLLVFPARLSADYSGTEIAVHDSPLAAAPLSGLLFLGGLLVVALVPLVARPPRAAGTARETGAMAAWIFLVPYAIVGNLIVPSAAGFAERLLYLPLLGFSLLAALALHRVAAWFPSAKPALAIGLVAALAGTALHTRAQARMWRSPRDLFERSLLAAPRSARFHIGLAHLHRREGDLDAARSHFEANAHDAPHDAGAWSDLGIFLAGIGADAQAEAALTRAVRLDPRRGEAHAHLGRLLRRSGRADEAERALRRALLLRPDLVLAAAELGQLLFDSGRYAEAAHVFRGCVLLGRTDLREMAERAETLALAHAPGG